MGNAWLIIASIILFIFSACSNNDVHYFDEAETYIDVDHDSLTYYLRLIKNPERLPPLQRARFGLMQVGHFSTDREGELFLDHSLNYYTNEKDTTMLIKSYTAKSYYYQNNMPKRIELFSLAKDLALKINNKTQAAYLYLHIGYCYEKQADLNAARNSFLKVLEYTSQDDLSYGLAHWHLARLYNKKGNTNEAIESFLHVVENAEIYFPQNLSPAYKQLSDMYLELEDYEKALTCINQSILHRTNIKEVPIYNLTKALIFINTQELDSARSFLNYAIESPNLYVSIRALGYLSQLNNKINQVDKAYYARGKEDESFLSARRHEEHNIVIQKYEEEKLKNENNQLKIEKQQQENYSLLITIVLLLVFALTSILYLYKQKQHALVAHQHKEQLLKEKALLHETQNLLLKHENELALLHQKAATLRATLFKKMSLYQKLPSLDKDGTERYNSGKINLTEQDIIELRRTVDAAYNDFSKSLANLYPSLSEDEIVFCCLIKIQVDMQDLSDIYCISKAGITKRKMRLKKDKLKITSDISLDTFIQDL